MAVYRHPYRTPQRRKNAAILVSPPVSVNSDVTTSAAVSLASATDVTTSTALSIADQIYVDAIVPRFTGTPANGAPLNSASFTPPDTSLLVVAVNADTGGGPTDITISVSGGSLSWTNEAERDGGDGGANSGHASLWTAEVATGPSMTVSVTRTAGDGSTNRISAKVYIVTGYKVGDPVGAVGEGSSATDNITPNAYTSTADNSRGFGAATDWNQLGLPTSTDEEDGDDFSGAISVVSLYKAADTPTASTVVTVNFQAGSAGAAAWNWVAIEVLPATGGVTVESNVTTTLAASTTNSGDVPTTLAASRSEQIELPTSAAVSQSGTTDVPTSAALSTTGVLNVTTDAATSRTELSNVTTTGAASRTEQGDVTTSGAASRSEQIEVPTDASVTVPGVSTSEVATSAATTRAEQIEVTTSGAVSQSVLANVTTSGALSRTEQANVTTDASTTVPGSVSIEVPTTATTSRVEQGNVTTDGALSVAAEINVTSSAAASQTEEAEVDTSGALSRSAETDVTTNAHVSIQGQVTIEVETSAAISPPAALAIDIRTLSASWIDRRTIAANWMDSRIIDLP